MRINSEEEYQYILKQLDAGSYQKIQFFIGGRRDSGSSSIGQMKMMNYMEIRLILHHTGAVQNG